MEACTLQRTQINYTDSIDFMDSTDFIDFISWNMLVELKILSNIGKQSRDD